MISDPLSWLQAWYASLCDGDWEHCYGISIESLDNPGWALKIHMDDTELDDKNFNALEVRRSEQDWLKCWVGEGELNRAHSKTMFQAFCGPHNLTEVLQVFRSWAVTVSDFSGPPSNATQPQL